MLVQSELKVTLKMINYTTFFNHLDQCGELQESVVLCQSNVSKTGLNTETSSKTTLTGGNVRVTLKTTTLVIDGRGYTSDWA